MKRLFLTGLLGVLVALGIGWFVARVLLENGADDAAPATAATAAGEPDARKIRANLYYVSEDGLRLVAVERDVPFGADTAEQARRLLEAQLLAAPEPYAQAIPEGTTLRALFLTEGGDAYADFTGELRSRHPGGSLDELFSVYAIVNAVTVNLPAIKRVQILIEGKEVDTMAGHVDLRQPLARSMLWVEPPAASPAPVTPAGTDAAAAPAVQNR
ncbi:MAG: GerMN domain-containing protein [Vicinamibacteraceae bacterium]|nr:GerMN domain-containing protein [Vicinamibacteraceae bacterium]